METFSGQRQIPFTKASDAELWCFLYLHRTNGWVNNRDAGDLRRHRARYDVTVMFRNTGNTVTLAFQCPTYLNTIITVYAITGGIMTSVIYDITPIAWIFWQGNIINTII